MLLCISKMKLESQLVGYAILISINIMLFVSIKEGAQIYQHFNFRIKIMLVKVVLFVKMFKKAPFLICF